FVFRNDSSIGSSVASVYFENVPVASDLSNPIITMGEPGVSFSAGADPMRPPGSIDAIFSPWSGNLFSAQADAPKPNEGINPAERLTISFDNGGSFSDMLTALRDGSGSFRVAAHVIGLPGGESVWISNVPAPAPLALLGLAGLAATRRRR